MPKAAPNSTIDPMLNEIATATRLTVLTGQPANFAGIAALLLASVALTPGAGNGDFTIADGAVNGRRVTIAQQLDIPITNTGDADHVALDDGVDLIYVTTATLQSLTSGGTVTTGSWDVEVADPV